MNYPQRQHRRFSSRLSGCLARSLSHFHNDMNRRPWFYVKRFPSTQASTPLRSRRDFFLSNKLAKHASPDDLACSASNESRIRIERIQSRLPRFLRRFVDPLVNAPITHISAFLILHEITALVPLLGLAAVFHYTKWMPPFVGEGKWVADGVQKYGSYLRKKGWLGEEEGRKYRWWGRGEGGTRIVVECVLFWSSRIYLKDQSRLTGPLDWQPRMLSRKRFCHSDYYSVYGPHPGSLELQSYHGRVSLRDYCGEHPSNDICQSVRIL